MNAWQTRARYHILSVDDVVWCANSTCACLITYSVPRLSISVLIARHIFANSSVTCAYDIEQRDGRVSQPRKGLFLLRWDGGRVQPRWVRALRFDRRGRSGLGDQQRRQQHTYLVCGSRFFSRGHHHFAGWNVGALPNQSAHVGSALGLLALACWHDCTEALLRHEVRHVNRCVPS